VSDEWPRPLAAPWWVWLIIFIYWIVLCAFDLLSPRNWREWRRVGLRVRNDNAPQSRFACDGH
jgi:hypothetical protein